MKNSLSGKRICVTGGGGFLGQRVVADLSARGHNDVFVVRRRDYDLVHAEDCERLYHDAKPQILFIWQGSSAVLEQIAKTLAGSSMRIR